MAPRVEGSPVRTSSIVCAVFADRAAADRAWNAAAAHGYTTKDISVVMSDEARKKHFIVKSLPSKDKSLEGAGVGGAIGTTVGAIAATLVAVGTTVAIPGLGIVIAGPILAALAGAGAGAALGGVVGALVGMGFSEQRVKLVEDHVRAGRIVLTVKAHSLADAETIEREWKRDAVEILQ